MSEPALAVCAAVAAVSFALPLTGPRGQPLSLGGHLLLFCHLG